MKKFLKYIFIILVINILAICLGQSNIYATSVTVELNTNKNIYEINENVIVTINWGQEMQAGDFVLQYDLTKLSFVSSSIGQDFYTISTDSSATNCNQIVVSWASITEQVAQEVKLTNMTFTFKAIGKGQTQINIKNVESLADENLVIPDQIDYTSRGSKTINIRMLGDINLDGSINNVDLTILRRYIAGEEELTDEQLIRSDLNCDMIINECDLLIMRSFMVDTSISLPIRLIKNVSLKNFAFDNMSVISGFETTNINVANLLSNFNIDHYDYTTNVYDINENKLEGSEKVGTGVVVKINEITLEGEKSSFGKYNIVIYGDTNGDGSINSVDALSVVKNKLNILNFSDKVFEEAGRVTETTRNSREIPSAVDALAIVKHKLGTGTIIQ